MNNTSSWPRGGPDGLIWSLLLAISLYFRGILLRKGIQGERVSSSLCVELIQERSWEYIQKQLTSLSFLPFLFERARVHICRSSLDFLPAPSKHALGNPDPVKNWKTQDTLRPFICVLGKHTVAELVWQTSGCFGTSWANIEGLSRARKILSEAKGSCENSRRADLCLCHGKCGDGANWITGQERNVTRLLPWPFSGSQHLTPLVNSLYSPFWQHKATLSCFWPFYYQHSWEGWQERV